jgi:hypothetical protein
MGQQWDGGDIAFRPETWATVATILRPGAFLVAFGGTRTYHRLVSAIEDAGFVIQDQIAWLFATGFPKRRDMLKPAFEPIVLAYKPGGKRAMQVDECRIEANGRPAIEVTGGLSGGVTFHQNGSATTATTRLWRASRLARPDNHKMTVAKVAFWVHQTARLAARNMVTPARPPAFSSPRKPARKTAGAAVTPP